MLPLIGTAITAISTILAAWMTLKASRERAEKNRALADTQRLEGVVSQTIGIPPAAAITFSEEAAFARNIELARLNYQIRCKLQPSEGNTLALGLEISFTAVNYAAVARQYHGAPRVFRQRADDTSRVVRVWATGTDLRGQEYDISFLSDAEREQTEVPTVWLPPNSSSPDNRFGFQATRTVEQKDTEVIFLPHPTFGIEVEVDGLPTGWEVQVNFGHRLRSEVELIPPNNPKRWRLRKAFMPWQGLYIEWRHHSKQGWIP